MIYETECLYKWYSVPWSGAAHDVPPPGVRGVGGDTGPELSRPGVSCQVWPGRTGGSTESGAGVSLTEPVPSPDSPHGPQPAARTAG